jgi:[glutamine synthetase] adenylyltransferase / [glutamine synthetase]-adenylyl-L-tyrosine phosphorylase
LELENEDGAQLTVLPKALLRYAEQSASPEAVRIGLERMVEEGPDRLGRLVSGREISPAGRALVAVMSASRSLTRLCLADPDALDVLERAESPVAVDATDVESLARTKRLEVLRIAALDLLGLEPLEEVGRALSRLAEDVLEGALTLSDAAASGFAIIGMGKLGGSELNYSSDVDVVFVAEAAADEAKARQLLAVARKCFRVDANLRPDGRSGPLVRPLESYRGYWRTRAATWEMQSLIKARPVAGDGLLGRRFAEAAEEALWGRTYSADELAQVRAMKARSESLVARRGLAGREIKRGPGGIRDVEFAVQILQMVHGRSDPDIRDRSTLGALGELSDAGYIADEDADALSEAYRFLRTLEHRLQLVEEEQTHAVPTEPSAHSHLARVLGYRDSPSSTASASFDRALHRYQGEVRAVHERLYFRPLLEAFASTSTMSGGPGRVARSGTVDTDETVGGGEEAQPTNVMDMAAVSERLNAFGFADVERTRAAVRELAGGLTRSSRLMEQLLPLLLDWLSLSPDPDLGLVGLRNLVVHGHHNSLIVSTFRDSPEAARRLCLLLGTSRVLTEWVRQNPELISSLSNDEALVPASLQDFVAEAEARMGRYESDEQRRAQLIRMRQDQTVKIASRDILEIDDVQAVGTELSTLAESLLQSALDLAQPELPFCVIGMGRLGGGELSYASDLDVLFVYDDAQLSGRTAQQEGQDVAEALFGFLRGPSPSQQIAMLDLGLRPEGAQGRLARGLNAHAMYFARWAQTWERQAMLRARLVAGDQDLGERFLAAVANFIWDREFTEENVAEVRRMKARIERERIPAREDPEFHLKLGKGSLSDVEWTVQLLQLRHRVMGTGTMEVLDKLVSKELVGPEDAQALRGSYRFCEHTRNRWFLVGALPGGGHPGDALPTDAYQMSRLARSLGTTPASLRDEYRRVTRRARRVTERLFYGLDP